MVAGSISWSREKIIEGSSVQTDLPLVVFKSAGNAVSQQWKPLMPQCPANTVVSCAYSSDTCSVKEGDFAATVSSELLPAQETACIAVEGTSSREASICVIGDVKEPADCIFNKGIGEHFYDFDHLLSRQDHRSLRPGTTQVGASCHSCGRQGCRTDYLYQKTTI